MSILIDFDSVHVSKSDDGENGRVVGEFDSDAMQVVLLGALRAQEVHALRRGGDGDPAHVVQPAGLLGDRLQFVVQAYGVALQRRHVGIRVEGVEAAGCVPGRSRGQLGTLDEDHVGPAQLGQVVQHAAAHHPAADDGDLCV